MAQSKSTKSQTTTNNEDNKGALSGIVLAPGEVISGVDKAGNQASYEIRNYLGEGWTAVVYAGMNKASKQPVALKVLRPNSDKLTIDNFRGEKEILDDIRAQNVTCVPEVYGLFVNTEKNLEFIAMEFVSESDYPRLDHILEFQGLLNEEDVLEISRQAGTLLDRLHTRVNRTYTDMQLKDFCWNAPARKLMVIDWNHVSFKREIIEAGKQNNPLVKQQLQARGAEDFDELARLDVRRFATYIYTLLTGKQVLEVGETSWGLKARAGGHWNRISEAIRLIVFKALVSYPGLQPYQSAAELLKDIESAIDLSKRKDIEYLTDELGKDLDEVEDNDGLADTDEQINDWVPQRLEKINRVSALLDQVRSLPEAQDLILQKRLARYEERITSLFDGVPDNWATGQRYFDVEQYLTALDLWEPLAEKRQTVHLWRQILLARAASNVSNFAQMKTYLEEALRNLKNGEIENALLQFNSGVASAREIPDSLAVIKSELEALQNIKKASEVRSLNEVEALLKKTEHVLKEGEVPYIDILMRDPVWFGYVGSWLSDKDKEVFDQSGKADIFAVIRNRLGLLKAQASVEADEKKNFNENLKFIEELIRNPSHDRWELLKDRLWGKPGDEVLFRVIHHVFDLFAKSEKKEDQEKYDLIFRKIIWFVLQWGAPSAEMEKILREDFRLLNTRIYSSSLETFVNMGLWHSAEEAARRIVLLLGQIVVENETVRRLEEEFLKRVESCKEIINGNSLIELFDSGIDDLIHFDIVLDILTVPDKASKRKTLIAAIAKKRKKSAEIETEFQKREDLLTENERQNLSERRRLEVEKNISSLKSNLIVKVVSEMRSPSENTFSDYRSLIEIIKSHIQDMQARYPKPTPDLEDWLKTWTNYKKDLEETMKQQRLFTEFKQSLRSCALAVAVWDQHQANAHLKTSEDKLKELKFDFEMIARDLFDKTSIISSNLGINKKKLDDLIADVKSFEFSNDNQDIEKLRKMRRDYDDLLRIQLEHAGKLTDIFPQFSYYGLYAVDREINNLELRSSIIAMLTNVVSTPPKNLPPEPEFHSEKLSPVQLFFAKYSRRMLFSLGALVLIGLLAWGGIYLWGKYQANETDMAPVNETAMLFAYETATAFANETATAFANETATAFVNETATAFANETATAFADNASTTIPTNETVPTQIILQGKVRLGTNIRAEPSTSASIIGASDDKLHNFIGKNGDSTWVLIEPCGWVSVERLSIEGDLNSLPIVDTTCQIFTPTPTATITLTITSTPTSTSTTTPTPTLTPTPTTKP